MDSDIIMEISRQTPTIGVLMFIVIYFMKQLDKKDKQIIDVIEKFNTAMRENTSALNGLQRTIDAVESVFANKR